MNTYRELIRIFGTILWSLVCIQSYVQSIIIIYMHVHDTPAQMAIDEYIAPTATAGWQGRPRTTLPATLDNGLHGVGKRLRNKQDLQHLRTLEGARASTGAARAYIMCGCRSKYIVE